MKTIIKDVRTALAARVRRVAGREVRQAGTVTPFVVIMAVVLLAMAGLVLDGGLALSAKAQALDIAQAAARAGAQELNLTSFRAGGTGELDPGRAQATARAWLSRARQSGEVSATATTVTVTVHRTGRTQLLQLVGIGHFDVAATATATPTQG